MADNITVTPGTGATIAAENLGGALVQRVKTVIGNLDVDGGDVSATNPMPVSLSSIPLAASASTSTLQSAAISVLNTIATNTGFQATDTMVNGTITALNGTVSVAAQGFYTVSISITGTWSATLVVQGQLADNSWVSLPVSVLSTSLPWKNVASITANGTYIVTSGGFQNVRILASAFTSGTVNVGLESSLAQMTVIPVTPQAFNYTYINANGTTVIKSTFGRLHLIHGATNTAGSLTVYDNTAGSGTIILVHTGGGTGDVGWSTGTIDCAFNTGLTVVAAGGWTGTIYWD